MSSQIQPPTSMRPTTPTTAPATEPTWSPPRGYSDLDVGIVRTTPQPLRAKDVPERIIIGAIMGLESVGLKISAKTGIPNWAAVIGTMTMAPATVGAALGAAGGHAGIVIGAAVGFLLGAAGTVVRVAVGRSVH